MNVNNLNVDSIHINIIEKTILELKFGSCESCSILIRNQIMYQIIAIKFSKISIGILLFQEKILILQILEIQLFIDQIRSF